MHRHTLTHAQKLTLGVLYCTCSCTWSRFFNNLKVIKPYNNGPMLYTHFADIVIASAGQCERQEVGEFILGFGGMFCINYWVKYWVVASPFLHNLGERFVTQIGDRMDDMKLDDIHKMLLKFISWNRLRERNRDEIDSARFAAHYPLPPNGRNYALGLQQGTLTQLVHTTHFSCDKNVYCMSKSAARPVFRVILWRNNPFHLYTGFVEANISTGKPSQEHKRYGGEHPMW